MICIKCRCDNWDKIKDKLLGYKCYSKYECVGSFSVSTEQEVEFECLECGYKWIDTFTVDEVY